MKTILATGGLGFIGSHTCVSLLNAGYKIIIIDSLINSSIGTLKNIGIINNNFSLTSENQVTFKKGDLRDFKFIDNIFEEARISDQPIDAVIHFAGLKSVEESIIKPLAYWDSNVSGTINLLNAMKKNHCHSIVFSSSATIYKSKLIENINEEADISPLTPYGLTKLTNEQILGDVFKSSNKKWKIVILRYFNPIGAHPSGLLGERPVGKPNNLFPVIMEVINGNLDCVSIFGKDWPTEDGTCIRDFIHVMDLAEAHVQALNFLKNSKPTFNILNIGTGVGSSVLEVIETFKEVNNCKLPYRFTDRRKGDKSRVVADNNLALKLLNWRPKRDLKDMCRDGYNWQKKTRVLD